MDDVLYSLACAFVFGPVAAWLMFMLVRLAIFVRGVQAERARRSGVWPKISGDPAH